MRTKVISIIFILLSFVLLSLWFKFNYETKQLEKKIKELNSSIIISYETNKVLLSELEAHSSPLYLNKLANLYFDNQNISKEEAIILSKEVFYEKINNINMIFPVNSSQQSNDEF